MKLMRKNGGITLVELIVVIAILAILAAVAIPAYSGYISKAQEANDMTLLDSVKTAVAFAVTEQDHDAILKTIEVTKTGSGDSVTYAVKAVYSTATPIDAADTDGERDDKTVADVDISDFVPSIAFKSNATKATLDLTAATPKWVLE